MGVGGVPYAKPLLGYPSTPPLYFKEILFKGLGVLCVTRHFNRHYGYLGNDILEVALSPRLCGVGHHGQGRVVVLLVLVVQEHQL